MTEKRFKLGYVCGDFGLIDNDEWIDLHSMSENSEKNVRICINKMNELSEENEQLEQFKEYVFDLIDKEIKETKEIFEDGKIDLMTYNASMITLTGLKEQLKGDME